MSEMMIYGLSALFACFGVMTFLLHRIETGIFPEDYEFKLDPFWYVITIMFLGATLSFFAFPVYGDMVHPVRYINILLPFVFAVLMYLCCLCGSLFFMKIATFLGAAVISYMLPDDFQLFPEQLSLWQDRFVVVIFLFAISRGLEMLNGLGAIASIQFCAVMMGAILIAYLGGLPQILGVIAFAYLGTMLAFTFLSWPPEKMIMSVGGFSSFGFILGCFAINCSTEFAETPIFITLAYLVTEFFIAIYNRYICFDKKEDLYMNTYYYQISDEGKNELAVVRGVLKIVAINVILSIFQVAAQDRLALPFFAVALDLYFLSILSGDNTPVKYFSLTQMGARTIKGIFSKRKNKDDGA